MPDELWEKIWKMTQHPYSEQESFHSGLKHVKRDLVEIEQDRVTDLFGAVGNLHMMVFEILYKHAYITVTPPLLELESLDVWNSDGAANKIPYVRYIFSLYQKSLEKAVSRWMDIEDKDDEEEQDKPMTLDAMIRTGRHTLSRKSIPPFQKRAAQGAWARDNELIVTSPTHGRTVALFRGLAEAALAAG